MGSKKHKKHKDKKSGYDENPSEQRPLKLVLKVGSSSSTAINESSLLAAQLAGGPASSLGTGEETHGTDQLQSHGDENMPRLTLAVDGSVKDEPGSTSGAVGHSSSSGKKVKKKKKSKKHHKHGHHHSHHSHHHHRHHRRSSCSHHSKSSSQHHSSDQQPSNGSLSLSSVKPNIVSSKGDVIGGPQQPLPPKSPQQRVVVSTGGKTGSKSQFLQFLGSLLKLLQRRDTQDFFAWPVTDMIAPGYSSIISHPMDFSTMKKKIDQGLYDTLDQFRSDVKLICDNAMVYNRPETIYYKAARKLWHYARCKIFNKNILPDLAKPYPDLSPAQLGYDMEEYSAMDIDGSSNQRSSGENGSYYSSGVACSASLDSSRLIHDKENGEYRAIDMIDDEEMTADQILEEAKKSAKWAADRLTLAKPQGSNLSFLRQKDDGTTTLGIIGCPGGNEKTVTLESIVGRLNEGTSCIPPYTEPESNRVKPMESVNTLPFSSFLPSVDSSSATLNAEETQLLTSTYGEDELGLHYTQSLLSFASDNDYVMNMVGSLLEVLTQGQHSKALGKLKEIHKEKGKEKEKEKEKEKDKDKDKDKEKSKKKEEEKEKEEDSLTTDMEILANNLDDQDGGIQPQLDSNTNLFNQLQNLNNQRLASSTQPIPPSDDEMKLANILCEKLTSFISNHATPGDVSDPRAIRKALGIQIKTE